MVITMSNYDEHVTAPTPAEQQWAVTMQAAKDRPGALVTSYTGEDRQALEDEAAKHDRRAAELRRAAGSGVSS
jgi:hypothetical protein